MTREELHEELRRWRKIRSGTRRVLRVWKWTQRFQGLSEKDKYMVRSAEDAARSARIKVRKLQDEWNAGLEWLYGDTVAHKIFRINRRHRVIWYGPMHGDDVYEYRLRLIHDPRSSDE